MLEFTIQQQHDIVQVASTAIWLPVQDVDKSTRLKSICGDVVVNIDIANLHVGLFGKERKSLKIECSNPSTRIYLLKQARIRRPTGLFLSEFLTPAKNSVFYNLRQLRKQYPDRFKSVFTRGGNVYYRLSSSDHLYQVSSLADLEKINLQGRGEESSPAT